jgi:hypothetical protein
MHERDGFQHLFEKHRGLFFRERPDLQDPLEQVATGEPLHDDIAAFVVLEELEISLELFSGALLWELLKTW